MGMKDYNDNTYLIKKHWNRIHGNNSGTVVTLFGIVDISWDGNAITDTSSWPFGRSPRTFMAFSYNKVLHTRHWKEVFSNRTLVMLAKRFAKDAIEIDTPSKLKSIC